MLEDGHVSSTLLLPVGWNNAALHNLVKLVFVQMKLEGVSSINLKNFDYAWGSLLK